MRIRLVALLSFACAMFVAAESHAAEREVSIACDWGIIGATLNVPDEGTNVAVLIVAGSGPTDRNGNSGYNLNTYCYKMLSDALVAEGFATLRYDKRGVGMSYLPAEHVPKLVFNDFVDDASRCVEYLHNEGFERVVVVGHSEGGQIALEMATRDAMQPDGVVLLCTPGYSIDVVLTRQLTEQLMPDNMGLMLRASNIIRTLKQGNMVAAEDIPEELTSLFNPTVQPFIISNMQSNPQTLAAACRCPMLIVAGGYDIQVTSNDAEQLKKAAPEAQYTLFERMAHTLKDSDTSDRMEQLLSVYTNPQLPLTEGLAECLATFIRRHTNI